jgi:hypothetical protein
MDEANKKSWPQRRLSDTNFLWLVAIRHPKLNPPFTIAKTAADLSSVEGKKVECPKQKPEFGGIHRTTNSER